MTQIFFFLPHPSLVTRSGPTAWNVISINGKQGEDFAEALSLKWKTLSSYHPGELQLVVGVGHRKGANVLDILVTYCKEVRYQSCGKLSALSA